MFYQVSGECSFVTFTIGDLYHVLLVPIPVHVVMVSLAIAQFTGLLVLLGIAQGMNIQVDEQFSSKCWLVV